MPLNLTLAQAPAYEHIYSQVCRLPNTVVAGTYWFIVIGDQIASGTGASNARSYLVWNAARFPGISKLNLHVSHSATAAQTGVTFVYGLYPVAWSGTTTQAPTLGTVVTGSTVTFVAPGAHVELEGASTDFTPPAADTYMIGCVTNATIPASCQNMSQAILRGR